ncbi:DNA polymerase III subunit chi [Shewanella donghaensis]|uniref:DNA polymerase III subunit chi n=1 Tax=Shewanella donghaensis TaxID=238836 RepID=UPI0011842836|nr:DNA polymerase III subunit chi [Shewanella donghaensis]
MSKTLFYLMPALNTQATAAESVYLAACQIAEQHYRQQKLVYIHCQSKQQAYAIDELLWQFEPTAFVPHNLKGEGPITGSPVEIGFDKLGANKSRQLLINLADQVPTFAVKFPQIIDFVANDDALKNIARLRYREYKQLGITLDTAELPF